MARQALGKGLGALIMKKQETSTPPANVVADTDRVIVANVRDIKASPFQPRRHFDNELIAELAASIKESGLLQPLVVRKVNGTFELIAGERRLRAVTSLGHTTVKVVVHEASDQEVAELALIENLQRSDLNCVEEALGYQALVEDSGLTQEDMAIVMDQYEKLAELMLEREREGRPFTFYHYMIDLTGGPCVYKRISGCGSGTEYMAVTPWGDLYPCHQFVGQEQFLMGNVFEGITKPEIRDEFKCCNVLSK